MKWCVADVDMSLDLLHTSQEDGVSVLCITSLELDDTVQVRWLVVCHVTVMIWKELNNLLFLVDRQKLQHICCFFSDPGIIKTRKTGTSVQFPVGGAIIVCGQICYLANSFNFLWVLQWIFHFQTLSSEFCCSRSFSSSASWPEDPPLINHSLFKKRQLCLLTWHNWSWLLWSNLPSLTTSGSNINSSEMMQPPDTKISL